MWNRDTYAPSDHFVEDHFNLKTSSLVPGKPTIHHCNLTAISGIFYFNFYFASVTEPTVFVSLFVIENNFVQ